MHAARTAPIGGDAPPARPPRPDLADHLVALQRRRPLLAPGVVGAALLALVGYTAWQDPNGDGVFPSCGFKRLTGFDCIGCGGLRAAHALTRGDLLAAADHNLLITGLIPAVIVLWVSWVRAAAGGPQSPTVRMGPMRVLGLVLAIITFGVARNVSDLGPFGYLSSAA